jgi:hypothetical protein
VRSATRRNTSTGPALKMMPTLDTEIPRFVDAHALFAALTTVYSRNLCPTAVGDSRSIVRLSSWITWTIRRCLLLPREGLRKAWIRERMRSCTAQATRPQAVHNSRSAPVREASAPNHRRDTFITRLAAQLQRDSRTEGTNSCLMFRTIHPLMRTPGTCRAITRILKDMETSA